MGLFAAVYSNAQLLEMQLDTYAVHTEPFSDGTDLTGYTTYRLYAVVENENDFVANITGLQEFPLVISTTTDFYQNELGATLGHNMNPAVFGFAPAAEFDSFLTIGRENSTSPGVNIQAVQSSGEPWLTQFQAGGDIVIDGLFGGSWFIIFSAESVNGYPDEDGRVLIGQFTTTGDIVGFVNVQIFLGGVQSNSVIYENFAFTSVEGAVLGCTEEGADNYNPDATINDGSCIFPCNVGLAAINMTPPTCHNSTNGSIQFVPSGAQNGAFYSLNGGNFLANPTFNNRPAGEYTVVVQDGQGCSYEETFILEGPEAVVVSPAVVQQVTCNGAGNGIIGGEGTGGTGDLIYSLNASFDPSMDELSFTNLTPGSYTVYARDENNCTSQSSSISITQPTAIISSITATSAATCAENADGVIVVQTVGGGGGYQYSLDGENFAPGNIINAAPGVYTVSVQDANGCIVQTNNQATVGGPEPLEIETNTVTPLCAGDSNGSLTGEAVGGNGGYTYVVNDGEVLSELNLEDLGAGTIVIEVTDEEGCMATFTVSVEDPQVVSASTEVSDVLCEGDENGMIVVTAEGGTGDLSYALNEGDAGAANEFEGLMPGNYIITVTDENGCSVETEASVTEPNGLEITGSATQESEMGAGDANITVEVEGGTSPYSFDWSGPNGFTSSDESLSGVTAGSYDLTVTDANGCEITFSTDVTVGIEELGNGVQISAYPNPTNGVLFLNFEGLQGERVYYSILDASGRELDRVELNAGRTSYRETIDLSYAASGLYFVQLTVGEYTQAIRVMKQN